MVTASARLDRFLRGDRGAVDAGEPA
jgi:hypothetical protein